VDQATLQLGASLMNIIIQAGNLQHLKTALMSDCTAVRFGAEFCMYQIPTLSDVERAYVLTTKARRGFVYVTPRLADGAIEKIRKHLTLLNELGGGTVVINDLGTLRILRELSALHPHLGRQLVYTPSRCPWKTITEHSVSLFTRRKVKSIFYQTALNYGPTIDFFKNCGVVGADLDWIPEYFSQLRFLSRRQLDVAIHTHLIPVAITRKCHMARFHGEESLSQCSKPCYTSAYSMENELLNTPLFLHGNTVFRLTEPNRRYIPTLNKQGVNTLVLTMSPLTGLTTSEHLKTAIQQLQI
jgi:hypothetical protein